MKIIVYICLNLAALFLNWVSQDAELSLGLTVRMFTVVAFFWSTWRLGLGRRFGAIQWQLFQVAMAFGLWPFIVLGYLVFIPDNFATAFALGVMGSPANGLLAHDYIFSFQFLACTAYALCELWIKPNDESLYSFNKESLLAKRGSITLAAFGLIFVGTILLQLVPYVPVRVAQLVVLLTWMRYWGMFYLVIIYLATRGSSRSVQFNALMMVYLGIGFSGVVGFIQGGQKGQLVIQLFMVFLLTCIYDYRRGLRVGGICFALMIALVPVLPHINTVKLELQNTPVFDTGVGARFGMLLNTSSTKAQISSDRHFSSSLDYFFVYVINRIVLTHMTAAYVEAYVSTPVGFSSLTVPALGVVPRVFYPNKIDLDAHYNEIARTTGIGNLEDVETSRKPSLVEEAIYTAGFKGIVVFGLCFGVLLYWLDRIIRMKMFRPTVGMALAVTMAVANMMQYLGVIFAGLPYNVLFFILFGAIVLNRIVACLRWEQPVTFSPALFSGLKKWGRGMAGAGVCQTEVNVGFKRTRKPTA